MQTQQYDLFTTNSGTAGYRLSYLEIYNWGTFNGRIYRIAPEGNNSLLTGANASGKSTLIDALLSLIVPAKKNRFYNQSSGNDRKGDRTEETYVLGNYGNIQSEGETTTRTQQLRDKSTHSILLASFKNNHQSIVTLFQVRWFVNGELKCIHGLSTCPLTIKDDFSTFNGRRSDLKNTLENKYNSGEPRKRIELFEGVSEYKEKIINAFGLRSEKALTLFNQIIGVKVLNDLDDFIRNNMLEQRDAEEEYSQLNKSFSNLLEAKTTIEKVKEQIAQLEPIDQLAQQLSDINDDLERLQATRELAVYWFAQRNVTLADMKLAELNALLTTLNLQLEALNAEKESLNEHITQLTADIANDDVGKQISELDNEINRLEAEKKKRLSKLDQYNKAVNDVGLSGDPSRETFLDNLNKAQEEKNNCQQQLDSLNTELRHAENEKERIDNDIKDHIATLKTLYENNSNISGKVAEIREMIRQATGATTNEMPFVGELIQVKEDEREWENVIEKILHSFALCLIVPDNYYKAVNRYVNSHNLQGRIVYQRYRPTSSFKGFRTRNLGSNSLLNKIEFNVKSEYCEWVEDFIFNHYDYACVTSLEEFNSHPGNAVTVEGLIKTMNDKHQKDDRPQINSRTHYVLGWDNSAKIAAFKKSLAQLQEQQKANAKNDSKIRFKLESQERQRESYNDIIKLFPDYDGINWQELAKIIQDKIDKKKELENSNEKVKVMQQQLEQDKQSLRILENERIRSKNSEIFQIERVDLVKARNRKKTNQELIDHLGSVDVSSFEADNAQWIDVNYDNIETKRSAVQTEIETQEKYLKEKKAQIERHVTGLVAKFKNPPEEISQRFKDWRSDVHTLPDSQSIHLIGEYQKFYTQLTSNDLASHEKRFNNYLEETVTNKIADFRMFFRQWEDSIRGTIELLNKSLKEINFNSTKNTYIQLVNTRRFHSDIADFKNELENAIPNLHDVNATVDGRRNHFEKNIRPLMEHLHDEPWRKRVIDVRNWFSYKAEEFYRESGQKHKTYESMGQLSGGEKAQLTYTILGSAVAYQFGLTKDGLQAHSLRFIAIDEAFKAQDEDKARYLISLCDQLHLQLLVVTPSDNIHIVEDNISFVHFVERIGNESQLLDMTIKVFKDERLKYLSNDNAK